MNLAPDSPPEDEINLLDLLIVLAKHKIMILSVTFAAALLALGYALWLPNIYTGTAKILPPQQNQSSASAMLGQLGGLAGLAGGAMGIKNALTSSAPKPVNPPAIWDAKNIPSRNALAGGAGKPPTPTGVRGR